MKSASSLFAIAFGLMSFLKNLFVPQAMIRYLQKYFAYSTSNLLRYEIIRFLNLRDIFYQTYVVQKIQGFLPKRDMIKDERCYTQDGKAQPGQERYTEIEHIGYRFDDMSNHPQDVLNHQGDFLHLLHFFFQRFLFLVLFLFVGSIIIVLFFFLVILKLIPATSNGQNLIIFK